MTVGQMKAQGGVSNTDYLEPRSPFFRPRKTIGYSVKIIRDNSTLSNIIASGNVFNQEVRSALNVLQIGDKVVFYDIGIEDLCGSETILEPIEFVLE